MFTSNICAQENSLWKYVDTESGADLRDIFFLNDQYCWLIGNGPFVTATTDGGAVWNTYNLDESTVQRLDKIEFIDTHNGFALVVPPALLKTSDGGMTWEPIIAAVQDTAIVITDYSFQNAQAGWVSGYIMQQSGKTTAIVAHTSDGGDSWETEFSITGHRYFLNGIDFIDDKTGWAIGGPNMDNFDAVDIYHTTEGESWEKIGEFNHAAMMHIKAVDTHSIWINGPEYAVHSSDGGRTWDIQDGPFHYNENCWDIDPAGGNNAWLACSFSDAGIDEVRYTVDGGITFNLTIPFQGWRELIAVEATRQFGKEALWVIDTAGNLYVTVLTTTSIKEHQTENNAVRVVQNPFTSTIMLQYNLVTPSNIKVTLYSIAGQLIQSYDVGWLNAGQHVVRIDNSGLASGIYLYKFSAGPQISFGKILITK